MAQNDKALGVIALAMNAKFAAIKAGVTSDFDAHEASSTAWVVAQAADKAAFEAAYAAAKASNNTANLAALAAAEAAVDAAADLVANNPDATKNSILEAEAEMLANKAAADAFKTASLAEMLALRTAASDKMGVIGDFTNSVAAAWTTAVISGGGAPSGNAPAAYDIASFIGGTYPNITPTGDAEATAPIASLSNHTLPVIFSVQNPTGESGIAHQNGFSTVENILEKTFLLKGANESTSISAGVRDFWKWFMDLNNAPASTANIGDPIYDPIKAKWAELCVPAGFMADNQGSEDVFKHLGTAQFAWANLSKKGYSDTAYTKAEWKSDAVYFLTQFQVGVDKIQEMYDSGMTAYDQFADPLGGKIGEFSTLISAALTEQSSGYYYNGEGVGENLL